MGRSIALAAFVVLLAACGGGQVRPPNVVVVFLDQLRAFELGSYGNDFIRTPNMDRLAREGVRFELGITNNPLCTPARASLHTGKHSRTAMGAIGNEPADLGPQPNRDQLPDTTLAEVFHAAGYDTAVIGKWHLPPEPSLAGFDYELLAVDKAEKYYGRMLRENDEETFVEGYVLDYLSSKVTDYVSEHRDDPFFLLYNIELPHMPIGPGNMPDHYVTMYDPSDVPLRPNVFVEGVTARDEWWFKVYTIWDYIFRNVPNRVPDRASDKLPEGFDLRDLTAYYYGAVTAADDLVGDLLRALDANALTDNTLVVLSADHGENLGSHGWFNKDLLIDESIRIPMIFRYPAKLQPGVREQQIASTIDIMPTILELTELPVPENLHGQSLVPVIHGEQETLEQNFAIVETEFYHIGIRTPTHLYGREVMDTGMIESWPYFPSEPGAERVCFFDLRNDPYQQRNLAGSGEQAEVAAALRIRLDEWHRTTPWLHGSPPPLPEWMKPQ